MTQLSQKIRELAGKATPTLKDVSSTQMSNLLRLGGKHQRPRAQDWQEVRYEEDGQIIASLLNNLPTILAALELAERLEAPESVENVARQLYCAQEGIKLADNEAHVAYWFSEDDCAENQDVSIRPEFERMAQAAISAMKGERG